MSCFGCNRKYGLFCKEYGCPNCGYSFCGKCLKRPIAVARHNNKVMNVCLICYDKLSKTQTNEKVIDVDALPEIFMEQPKQATKQCKDSLTSDINAILEVESSAMLAMPEILVPTPYKSASTNNKTKSENSEINENLDTIIMKRLRNLKDCHPFSSDDELRNRLTDLKGTLATDNSKKDILLSTDQRSNKEKIDDLLKQFMEEVHLDNRIDKESNEALHDIERRLRALRDTPIKPQSLTDVNTIISDNEEDVDTISRQTSKKYLEESRLHEITSDLDAKEMTAVKLNIGRSKKVKNGDAEELPWCNICNEDAVYRCNGCDGDLYCTQCFHELHEFDDEYRTHDKVNFNAPPKFTEDHF